MILILTQDRECSLPKGEFVLFFCLSVLFSAGTTSQSRRLVGCSTGAFYFLPDTLLELVAKRGTQPEIVLRDTIFSSHQHCQHDN